MQVHQKEIRLPGRDVALLLSKELRIKVCVSVRPLYSRLGAQQRVQATETPETRTRTGQSNKAHHRLIDEPELPKSYLTTSFHLNSLDRGQRHQYLKKTTCEIEARGSLPRQGLRMDAFSCCLTDNKDTHPPKRTSKSEAIAIGGD